MCHSILAPAQVDIVQILHNARVLCRLAPRDKFNLVRMNLPASQTPVKRWSHTCSRRCSRPGSSPRVRRSSGTRTTPPPPPPPRPRRAHSPTAPAAACTAPSWPVPRRESRPSHEASAATSYSIKYTTRASRPSLHLAPPNPRYFGSVCPPWEPVKPAQSVPTLVSVIGEPSFSTAESATKGTHTACQPASPGRAVHTQCFRRMVP